MVPWRRRRLTQRIISLAISAAILVAAGVVAKRVVSKLRQPGPEDALVAALAQWFPGSAPRASWMGGGALRVSLKVPFDPTVDVRSAYDTFERVVEVAVAQRLPNVNSIEVVISGVSVDGRPTSASRTADYPSQGPSPASPPGPGGAPQ